jgi:CIC family chloride channel protein
VHHVFPNATAAPHAYALVGMGAFLAGTTHAPLTAILILFDMTLSHEIILPLMLACVVAYTVAITLRRESIYDFARRPREMAREALALEGLRVRDLMKKDPVCVRDRSRFPEIAQAFVKNRHHNLFVVDDTGDFRGVIPLHELKSHLNDVELAQLVIAQDLAHEDIPVVSPDMTLQETLVRFTGHTGERLPVVESGRRGKLVGTISKTDLLLTLAHVARSEPAVQR